MYLVLPGRLQIVGKLEIQTGLLTIPTSDWSDAMFVNSTVKLDFGIIRKLERAQIIALEQTAEYLHTEVVQAQVVPFDKGVLQGDAMAPDYSRSSQGVVSLVQLLTRDDCTFILNINSRRKKIFMQKGSGLKPGLMVARSHTK